MAKNKIPQFVKDAAVADYQSGSSIGEIVLSLKRDRFQSIHR